jgi:hypothetical protein
MAAIERAGAFGHLVLTVDRRMWMALHGSLAISRKSPVGIKGSLENSGTGIETKPF